MSQSRGTGNMNNLSNNQYYSTSSRATNYANAGGIVGLGTGTLAGSGTGNINYQNMEYRSGGHAAAAGSGAAAVVASSSSSGSGINNNNNDPFFQHSMNSAFQDIHALPQLSPSSSSSSSTGRTEADRDNLWYFTAEQLANSPSRRNGIDADQELSYRQMTACLIQEMGQRLQV